MNVKEVLKNGIDDIYVNLSSIISENIDEIALLDSFVIGTNATEIGVDTAQAQLEDALTEIVYIERSILKVVQAIDVVKSVPHAIPRRGALTTHVRRAERLAQELKNYIYNHHDYTDVPF